MSSAAPQGTVFVVDDDASTRKALARLIGSVGLAAEVFPSAAAFLDHPRTEDPACIVLDLRMPGASGLALQEQLAKSGIDLPIVFLTGHADVPTSVQAMKAGAVDLIEKPFRAQELLDAIQRALGRARSLQAARGEREAVARLVETLTPREREVFGLVVTGLSNKEVGARLGASEKTIKVHRARVMEKMRAASLADLVRKAQVVGIGPAGHASSHA
jgi:RNA polymerase sigma factor (sigma-70 family)